MPKGVRLNPEHDLRTRAKIQTSQIINRLIKHINGEIEMTTTQIRAAEILLKKTLPDLTAIAYTDISESSQTPQITSTDRAALKRFIVSDKAHEILQDQSS